MANVDLDLVLASRSTLGNGGQVGERVPAPARSHPVKAPLFNADLGTAEEAGG
jgi:hypothetical protein